MRSNKKSDTLNVTCTGWTVLHLVCFLNGIILVWVVSGITPVYKDGSFNHYLIFGLFPLATSCTIHAYYKCVKVRPILPITDPPALGGNGSTYIPVPMGQY